ncbi:FAD:protein FMN transferase [Desulfosarcina widdelii]|nr:FAD:protein FMN transferase [Desulfosarcina widdelii]
MTIRALVVMMALVCTACLPQKEMRLGGATMGTTYHIKVVAGWFTSDTDLQARIDQRLAEINRSMSTYDPDSEISRFNRIHETDTPFTPSDDFAAVLRVAAELHRLTEGAWDGTLDPLINLWGFGRKGPTDTLPNEDAIQTALSNVGFDRIRMDASGTIAKRDAALTLDLASIAKGYGVDAIARLLAKNGFNDYLVEIGGEVVARGRRRDGNPWMVGINRPDRSAALDDVYKAVPLIDRAMATSGDYRIFFRKGGRIYSHILDPRTGRPVENGVVSATVVAANCTVADGLATALMVMGSQKGIDLVNRLEGVECLIVVRQSDGRFVDHPSRGFVIR